MKIGYRYWIAIVITVVFMSCRDSKKTDLGKLVTEWIGKEIIFPPDANCSYMGRDTLCPDLAHAPYKVLVYTDSTGCTSCKLNLHVWKTYMEEVDVFAPGQVDFLFYFQPKNRKELKHLLAREKIEHTVFIDEEGEISRINNFPEGMEYQCFLLDQGNNVLSIGNPVLNPKMWEIYKQVITSTP